MFNTWQKAKIRKTAIEVYETKFKKGSRRQRWGWRWDSRKRACRLYFSGATRRASRSFCRSDDPFGPAISTVVLQAGAQSGVPIDLAIEWLLAEQIAHLAGLDDLRDLIGEYYVPTPSDGAFEQDVSAPDLGEAT